MGEIRGVVSEELEKKFRKLDMEKFGYGKGSLSKALEEALRHWIKVLESARAHTHCQTDLSTFSPE